LANSLIPWDIVQDAQFGDKPAANLSNPRDTFGGAVHPSAPRRPVDYLGRLATVQTGKTSTGDSSYYLIASPAPA
jgi:hypothetical protein